MLQIVERVGGVPDAQRLGPANAVGGPSIAFGSSPAGPDGYGGPMQLRMIGRRAVGAFWVIPAAGALIAAGLALGTVWLERELGGSTGLFYGGGPDSARAILQTVGTSVLTFAGLTFSITVVALQLASSQFSPRVLNTLMRDRWTQSALGTFVGTFVFTLLVLREVRAQGQPFVPGLSVGIAVVLGLTSIGALVGFIHHIAQSLRVVTIIDRIFRATLRAVDTCYPDEDGDSAEEAAAAGDARPKPVPGGRHVATAGADGVLVELNHDALIDCAVRHEVTIELLAPVGSWVVRGQDLFVVHGTTDSVGELEALLRIGRERETAQDPSYGFRQLIDIAERALSPAVNDPTTAVQCLDRMHALLARLASRDLAVGDTRADGVLRLRVPAPSWPDFLALACDEVRHWAAGAPRVRRRMETMLGQLRGVVPAGRIAAVDEQLELLRAAGEDAGAAHDAGRGDPAEWPATRLEDR